MSLRSLMMVCLWTLGFVPPALSQVVGVDDQLAAMIERCAPTVHPETMAAVIGAESRGQQFAIADAGPVALPWSQRKHLVRSHYMGSQTAAVEKATELVANGHTVSLGLAQVNDRNLSKYGVTIRDMFDPCTNISVGSKILTAFYVKAVRRFGQTPAALHAALSAYNSGDWVRGAKDGYVGLVYRQVGRPLAMKQRSVVPAMNAAPSPGRTTVASQTKPTVRPVEFAMSARDFIVSTE